MAWRRRSMRLRLLLACSRGAAAAEFAIMVPIIAVLLIGTIDLAQFGNQRLVLEGAVRAAAGYAMGASGCNSTSTNCGTPIANVVTSYTGAVSGVTVTFPNATSGTYAASATAYNPSYCTWDNSTAVVACSGTCGADGVAAECPMHVYVAIQVSWTLPSPLMPFSLFPTTLSRTLAVRVT